MNLTTAADRRTSPRRRRSECAWMTTARVRPGREMLLLDLSNGGALVEGAVRLLPGARVELNLGIPGVQQPIRAQVLRCQVSRLQAEEVRYRAAVAFEWHVDLPINGADGDGYRLSSERGAGTGRSGSRYPPPQATRLETSIAD